jgi:phosphatidylinositol 4-kinase
MLHDVVGCMYHWFNSVECIDNLAIPNGNSEKLHHHHRSLSATINTSVSLSDLPHCHMNGNKTSIGDVRSGQAFDSGCTCVVTTSTSHCQCSASRLIAQDLFVQTLGQISNRLLKYSQRSLRTNQLYAEVSQLNLNLPARISIPLYLSNHHILRIPPSEAAVLNSKSKAPYLLLVEVAIVKDTFLSPLTKRYLDKSTMANVKL